MTVNITAQPIVAFKGVSHLKFEFFCKSNGLQWGNGLKGSRFKVHGSKLRVQRFKASRLKLDKVTMSGMMGMSGHTLSYSC